MKFSTDWLNLITAKATGLIFSLFDVNSAREVPFGIPQYVQCIIQGLISVLLCVLCTQYYTLFQCFFYRSTIILTLVENSNFFSILYLRKRNVNVNKRPHSCHNVDRLCLQTWHCLCPTVSAFANYPGRNTIGDRWIASVEY